MLNCRQRTYCPDPSCFDGVFPVHAGPLPLWCPAGFSYLSPSFAVLHEHPKCKGLKSFHPFLIFCGRGCSQHPTTSASPGSYWGHAPYLCASIHICTSATGNTHKLPHSLNGLFPPSLVLFPFILAHFSKKKRLQSGLIITAGAQM